MGRYKLGLVEFEKCAILQRAVTKPSNALGLVEFEKCAIFYRSTCRQVN